MTAAALVSRREALRCLDLGEALAQGADNPPAAEVGAERDRRGRQLRITQTGGAAFGGSTPAAISVSVITPIVFCASLVPCASETSDGRHDLAEPEARPASSCVRRARSAGRRGRWRPARPRRRSTGEATAGIRTFSTTVVEVHRARRRRRSRWRRSGRRTGRATSWRAGPSSQVSRFQTMAPTRPPKMHGTGVILPSSTMPPEMVLATSPTGTRRRG